MEKPERDVGRRGETKEKQGREGTQGQQKQKKRGGKEENMGERRREKMKKNEEKRREEERVEQARGAAKAVPGRTRQPYALVASYAASVPDIA
eukprot:1665432-Rhodomonas_salina.1